MEGERLLEKAAKEEIQENVLLAFGYVMATNMFTLVADYGIKLFNLNFSEVFFLMGSIGTLLYGAVLATKEGCNRLLVVASTTKHIALELTFVTVAGFGVLVSVGAVKLMPMADLVVIKFSGPIPTYILAILVLKVSPGLKSQWE